MFLKIFENVKKHGDLNPTIHCKILWNEYLKKKCVPKITDSELEKDLKAEKQMAKKIKIDSYDKFRMQKCDNFKSLKMLRDNEKLKVYSQVRDMIPKDALKIPTTPNTKPEPRSLN